MAASHVHAPNPQDVDGVLRALKNGESNKIAPLEHHIKPIQTDL
jgi:hypothetical protein